jgi:thymidylate kinase
VIVELVGPTGAGKSTLARLLRDRVSGSGPAVLGSDLVLDRPVLRRVANATAANLVQDAWGLPYLLRAAPGHAAFLMMASRMLRDHAPTRFDLLMNARSVMRRVGMYELARSRADSRTVFIDEGTVLIAYHLFVYSNADLDRADLERFADLVPLPDRVIYVRDPLPVLVQRAFSRPDPRRQLTDLGQAEVEASLRRAVDVFDRLTSTDRLRPRTLVVDNGASSLAALDGLVSRVTAQVRSWRSGDPAPARAVPGIAG